jgi:hypothetical protein
MPFDARRVAPDGGQNSPYRHPPPLANHKAVNRGGGPSGIKASFSIVAPSAPLSTARSAAWNRSIACIALWCGPAGHGHTVLETPRLLPPGNNQKPGASARLDSTRGMPRPLPTWLSMSPEALRFYGLPREMTQTNAGLTRR